MCAGPGVLRPMLHVFEDCRNSIARALGWVHHATAIHRGVGAGCVVVAQV